LKNYYSLTCPAILVIGPITLTATRAITTPMGSTDSGIEHLWRPNPEGCDECGHNGFKGRVGIYEVLGISIPIQKMITANATSNDIQDQAISEGMVTMQMDGLIKSLRGITTVDEVLRATRE
jgi:type IV pilus assembly protein PilB